jgi:hypothetical protein
MAARAEEGEVLVAIGVRPRERVVAAVLPVAVTIVFSAVVAGIVAALLSARFPFGDLRRVEPSPGIRLDGPVLAIGVLSVAVVLTACSWVAALHAQRRRARSEARVVPQVVAKGPMLLSTGASLAAGRRAPIRPALGASIVALAGVAAAATFGASLDRFLDEPARDGWAWDAEIGMGDELDDAAAIERAERLAERPLIEGVLLARVGSLPAGPSGDDTQIFGLRPVKGDVGLTLLEGQAPQRPDEVAIGADTADQRAAGVGDRIEVDGAQGPRTLRVTGIARFPVLNGDNPADGMALTLEGLTRLVPPSPQDGAFGFPTTLVDLAPGADRRAVLAMVGDNASLVTVRMKSTDVSNLEKVAGLPPVVAAVLATLGALGLVHAVLVATRRQRRDLAVLRALGFVRRQVWSLVGVQTAAYCFVGVVVGVPLGIIVGRWSWRVLARQLGAADDPLTPSSLLLIVPVTVVLIGVLALVVGRINAGGRPSVVLRTE